MTIKFAIKGVDLKGDLQVADEVDEFMLGFDWLTAQKESWDFHAKTLTMHGMTIPLCTPPSRMGRAQWDLYSFVLRERKGTNTSEH